MPSQKTKRREAPSLIVAPLFICFFSSPGAALCELGWSGVLFDLPEVLTPLRSSDLTLFYFCEFSLLFILATAILDSFFLLLQEMGGPIFGNRDIEVSLATSC